MMLNSSRNSTRGNNRSATAAVRRLQRAYLTPPDTMHVEVEPMSDDDDHPDAVAMEARCHRAELLQAAAEEKSIRAEKRARETRECYEAMADVAAREDDLSKSVDLADAYVHSEPLEPLYCATPEGFDLPSKSAVEHEREYAQRLEFAILASLDDPSVPHGNVFPHVFDYSTCPDGVPGCLCGTGHDLCDAMPELESIEPETQAAILMFAASTLPSTKFNMLVDSGASLGCRTSLEGAIIHSGRPYTGHSIAVGKQGATVSIEKTYCYMEQLTDKVGNVWHEARRAGYAPTGTCNIYSEIEASHEGAAFITNVPGRRQGRSMITKDGDERELYISGNGLGWLAATAITDAKSLQVLANAYSSALGQDPAAHVSILVRRVTPKFQWKSLATADAVMSFGASSADPLNLVDPRWDVTKLRALLARMLQAHMRAKNGTARPDDEVWGSWLASRGPAIAARLAELGVNAQPLFRQRA